IHSLDGDSNNTGQYYHKPPTDVESDLSDAVSGDSFTFDGSVPEPSEQNPEDAASSTILSNGATHTINAGKPEESSPYTPTDLCVWHSRFLGDPLQHWDGAASLSAYKSPPNRKQQGPGLFKWMCDYISSLSDLIGIQSERTAALIHLLRQKSEHSIPIAGATKGRYLEPNMTTWPPSLRYSPGKKAGRVHFLCLPYFTLAPYAAHQYSNTSDAHPTRSLLQTQYPSAAMERDLQQAVCQLQASDQRLCYHVPQLWCLYVENTLTSDFESDYYVVYAGVVQKPENWPNLMILAQKQTLRLLLRSRCNGKRRRRDSGSDSSSSGENSVELESSSSPAAVGSNPTVDSSQTALKPDATKIKRKKGRTPIPESNATYNMRSGDRASTTGAETQDVWAEDFHLFYWLAAVPRASKDTSRSTVFEQDENIGKKGIPMTIDNQQLKSRMSQLQKYRNQRYRVGRRAYAQCPMSGLAEVDAREAEIQRLAKGNDEREEPPSRRRARGTSDAEARRGHIENLEEDLERMSGQRRSSSEESRGRRIRRSPSVFVIRGVPQPETSSSLNQSALRDFAYYYLHRLRRLRSIMQPLARLLRQGPPPGMVNLPIELSRVWIHLLTFWVLATTKRSTRTLNAELGKCRSLLESSRVKLLQGRASHPLHHYEAVIPSGIVSLLVNKLAGDVASGSTDIEATYYEFVTKLEQEVQQRPYSRGHQEKITAVRQEISCVLTVLQDQSRCIEKFRSTVMKGRIEAPPRFPQRREAYILQNCLVSISDRIQNFGALDERARGIAAFNLYRIESNRDRQEGAILVFTIVTIVFLPLSFVSSFFGMNTSDIRGMATPQWAFWASAVPLTATVVGVSIFVARKIEPMKDWWSSVAERWKVKPKPVGNVFPAPGLVTQQPMQRMASGFSRQRPTQSYAWEESGGPRRRQTGGLQYRGYDV
ncbi:MAG: hypothetical protein Q9211_006344, partial [Gyalolechia sp. 1 TL-2023]